MCKICNKRSVKCSCAKIANIAGRYSYCPEVGLWSMILKPDVLCPFRDPGVVGVLQLGEGSSTDELCHFNDSLESLFLSWFPYHTVMEFVRMLSTVHL